MPMTEQKAWASSSGYTAMSPALSRSGGSEPSTNSAQHEPSSKVWKANTYCESGITLPAFIAERIFRESELPLIHEPIAAAEPAFELVALRNDREHYARTLVAWERNLMACREQAAAMVGEDAVVEHLRYLRVCAMAFKLDAICLLRMSFVKRNPATSILPDRFRSR